MEFMGNDYDGAAIGSLVPKLREKFFCLLRRLDRRWLVQDQDVGSAGLHFDVLNGLFLGNGHLINFLIRIQLKAILIHKSFDFLTHLIHL